MEWFYPKRRGPEWKQGWTGQTISSISTPPLPLLIIFGIVILLLWLSQYTGYKSQLHQTAMNLQIFILLLPILIIFLMAAYSSNWVLNFRTQRPQPDLVGSAGNSYPWGIAIFVALLLILVSYQSSFHSKWFGPLRSD